MTYHFHKLPVACPVCRERLNVVPVEGGRAVYCGSLPCDGVDEDREEENTTNDGREAPTVREALRAFLAVDWIGQAELDRLNAPEEYLGPDTRDHDER